MSIFTHSDKYPAGKKVAIFSTIPGSDSNVLSELLNVLAHKSHLLLSKQYVYVHFTKYVILYTKLSVIFTNIATNCLMWQIKCGITQIATNVSTFKVFLYDDSS